MYLRPGSHRTRLRCSGLSSKVSRPRRKNLTTPQLPMTEDVPALSGQPHSFRVTSNIAPTDLVHVKDCVLFYHPSCEELAKKVASDSDSITLGQIDWR
jgi:hypothetical protein